MSAVTQASQDYSIKKIDVTHKMTTSVQILSGFFGAYVALSFVRKTRLSELMPSGSQRAVLLAAQVLLIVGGWKFKEAREQEDLGQLSDTTGNVRSWENVNPSDTNEVEVGADYFVTKFRAGEILNDADEAALQNSRREVQMRIVEAMPTILSGPAELCALFFGTTGVLAQMGRFLSEDLLTEAVYYVRDFLILELSARRLESDFDSVVESYPFGDSEANKERWLSILDDVFDRRFVNVDSIVTILFRLVTGGETYLSNRLERDANNPTAFAAHWGENWKIYTADSNESQHIEQLLSQRLAAEISPYRSLEEIPAEIVGAIETLKLGHLLTDYYAQIIPAQADGRLFVEALQEIDLHYFPLEEDRTVRCEIVRRLIAQPKAELPADPAPLIAQLQLETAVQQVVVENPFGLYYSLGDQATEMALGGLNERALEQLDLKLTQLGDHFPHNSRKRTDFFSQKERGTIELLRWFFGSLRELAGPSISADGTMGHDYHRVFAQFYNGQNAPPLVDRLERVGDALLYNCPRVTRPTIREELMTLCSTTVLPDFVQTWGISNYELTPTRLEVLTQPLQFRELFAQKKIPALRARVLTMTNANRHTALFDAYERVFTDQDTRQATLVLLRLINTGQNLQWDGQMPSSPYAEIELYLWVHFFVTEHIKDELYLVEEAPLSELNNETAVRKALYLFAKGYIDRDRPIQVNAENMVKLIYKLESDPQNTHKFQILSNDPLPEDPTLNSAYEAFAANPTSRDLISAYQNAIINHFKSWLQEQQAMEVGDATYSQPVPPDFNWRPLIKMDGYTPSPLLVQLAQVICPPAYQPTSPAAPFPGYFLSLT